MDIQGLGNEMLQKSYPTSSNQQEPVARYEHKTKQNSEKSSQENAEYIPNIQEKTIISAIEQANKKFEGKESELSFSVHEKTKQIMVKIIDKETKEVIKEIPPEKILDMVAYMCEAAGIFVDEKR